VSFQKKKKKYLLCVARRPVKEKRRKRRTCCVARRTCCLQKKKERKHGKPRELILEKTKGVWQQFNSFPDLNLYSYFDLGIGYSSLSSYSYSGLEIFLFWF
jgi:hypothetical protein